MKEIEPTLFHIMLHHNADPDAICAAEVFRFIILSLKPEHEVIIYSDDMNTTATRIIETFDIKVSQEMPILDLNKSNRFLTVDTANLSQLGKYADFVEQNECELLVVDHHDTSELAEGAVVSIVVSDTASTCIIADKVIQIAELIPSPEIATLILSGHMYDSRRMLYGTTAEIFHRFGDLIEMGADFELANQLLQTKMDHGEIIARLKASQRLYYKKIGDIIVATSRIGAFEASVARSFIGMGADITFILAPKNEELRGSARTNIQEINIGEVMSSLGAEFGGTGGGHAAAAGLNIRPLPNKKVQTNILKRFVEIVEYQLTELDKTIKEEKF